MPSRETPPRCSKTDPPPKKRFEASVPSKTAPKRRRPKKFAAPSGGNVGPKLENQIFLVGLIPPDGEYRSAVPPLEHRPQRGGAAFCSREALPCPESRTLSHPREVVRHTPLSKAPPKSRCTKPDPPGIFCSRKDPARNSGRMKTAPLPKIGPAYSALKRHRIESLAVLIHPTMRSDHRKVPTEIPEAQNVQHIYFGCSAPNS